MKKCEGYMLLDKRERAEEKAKRLVEEKLSVKLPYCLKLNAKSEDFQTNLQIFKLLFHQEDPDYKMALWNKLLAYGNDLEPNLMTEEEQQFVIDLETACDSPHPKHTNFNTPFSTRRLCMRPTKGDEDYQLYYKHLKEDGDFSLFTNLKYTRANVQRFGFEMPYFFVVEERKNGNMVGYAGLRWEKTTGEKTGVMECEYYIFKPHRGKGYATEAMKAICHRAFSGKLFEKKETSYKYLCRKKIARPQVIRAMIRTDNILSCRLAESCGFKHMGTLQRHFLVENRYVVNGEIYELCKD